MITLERAPVDVTDVIASAVEQVRPLLLQRHQQLRFDVPATRLTVDGDAKRLVQVVSNLLNNAAKYTAPGGAIDIRLEADAASVRLTVSDTGIGMDCALMARAFDLHAQGERNADRSQGGLGIGLALVKNLIELHGGKVAAHSDGIGRGSDFTVTLPLAAVN